MDLQTLINELMALSLSLRESAKQPGPGDFYSGREAGLELAADELDELITKARAS